MSKIACSVLCLGFLVACDDARESGTAPDGAGPAEVSDDLGSATPLEPGEPGEPEENDPEELPFLVSRYAPTLGLPGVHVTILVAFESRGCAAAGECSVTIGGQLAEIASDANVLEVIVPRFVSTGPLCVTWRDRTECGEDFTVLPLPVLYSVSPEKVGVGSGDVTIDVYGDGFGDDVQVWLDWEPLASRIHSSSHLQATVPASYFEAAGPHDLQVYSPSIGRCGAASMPLVMTVE